MDAGNSRGTGRTVCDEPAQASDSVTDRHEPGRGPRVLSTPTRPRSRAQTATRSTSRSASGRFAKSGSRHQTRSCSRAWASRRHSRRLARNSREHSRTKLSAASRSDTPISTWCASAVKRTQADRAWQQWSKTRAISNIPTSVLNSMDGKDRDALEATDSAHASGKDIQTDWSTFYDLRQQASVNPAAVRADGHSSVLPAAQPGAARAVDRHAESSERAGRQRRADLNEQLGRAHELLGWSASDGQKKGQFDSAALTAIDAAQKANGGKKLSYDDRQKVVDRMMVTGSYPGGNWFSQGSLLLRWPARRRSRNSRRKFLTMSARRLRRRSPARSSLSRTTQL
jgi:hypothetical protein